MLAWSTCTLNKSTPHTKFLVTPIGYPLATYTHTLKLHSFKCIHRISPHWLNTASTGYACSLWELNCSVASVQPIWNAFRPAQARPTVSHLLLATCCCNTTPGSAFWKLIKSYFNLTRQAHNGFHVCVLSCMGFIPQELLHMHSWASPNHQEKDMAVINYTRRSRAY